jgi:hypothetical protein
MEKKQEAVKRWFVHCDFCSYHRIFDQAEDLIEIKTSPIPGGSPELNLETKKTTTKPTQAQPKKIKCPSCGRGTVVKKLPEVYSKAFKKIDEEERQRNEQAERERRIRDGQPIKREKDASFLG